MADVDTAGRLMAAAQPVLAEMAGQLTGTRFCFVLADRDARILHRWADTAAIERAMDDISAVPGTRYAEESVGTNAIGTPVELRHGIVVHGEEHFNEQLKGFSCYGHPIQHPLTRRVEGVLDITGITADANPMLAPFLVRAVRDIEQRLAEGARVSDRRLLEAFHQVTQRRIHPVAALGHDLVLTNKAAVDLLDVTDHGTLRALAESPQRRESWQRQLRLATGTLVNVRVERVEGADGGTLFHLDPIDRPGESTPFEGTTPPRAQRPGDRLRALRSATGAVVVAGEPGTGRSSAVRVISGNRPSTVLHAAEVAITGETEWAGRLQEALRQPSDLVVIEDFHLLPDTLCALLAKLVAERAERPVVLTSGPVERLEPLAAGVAACCVERADLPALRNRVDELPQLAREMLADLCPGGAPRLTPSALEALASQPWPGNLSELNVLLRRLVQQRSAGDITLADLPEDYRGVGRASRLAGRERAERAAIVDALRTSGGNKSRAASQLGISRTTLYSRMRALGVAG